MPLDYKSYLDSWLNFDLGGFDVLEDKEIVEPNSNNDLQANENLEIYTSTAEYERVVNTLDNLQVIGIGIVVSLGLIAGILSIKTLGYFLKW